MMEYPGNVKYVKDIFPTALSRILPSSRVHTDLPTDGAPEDHRRPSPRTQPRELSLVPPPKPMAK